MAKIAGYLEPSDYPIPVAAHDPLEGDLLFGIEDRHDVLREKADYEEAEDDGKYHLKESATKSQLDRLARDIQPKIKKVGPRFGRFIARLQAAMQLGVSKSDMLDMFYQGKDEVDPFRVAAAGYAAEARFLATAEDEARDLSDLEEIKEQIEQDYIPEFLQTVDNISPDGEDDYNSDHWFDDTPDNEREFFDETFPSEVQAEPIPVAASVVVNGRDEDYDWLLPPVTAQEMNQLQANDIVETSEGSEGTVTEVQPDGSFTVDMTSAPGGVQNVTYGQEALDSGEVKRQEQETTVTPTPGGALYS